MYGIMYYIYLLNDVFNSELNPPLSLNKKIILNLTPYIMAYRTTMIDDLIIVRYLCWWYRINCIKLILQSNFPDFKYNLIQYQAMHFYKIFITVPIIIYSMQYYWNSIGQRKFRKLRNNGSRRRGWKYCAGPVVKFFKFLTEILLYCHYRS